jgi:hypothetical protein
MSFFRQRVGVALASLAAISLNAAPSIEITNVPPYGSFSDLGGRVLNGDPSTQRMAVFIYLPFAGWWSKPYCNPQLTVIQPNGSWTADITTGGSDELATKITALLVPATYAEPCVEGLAALPANVLAQALASATVEREDPSIRRINFSGYDWWVKSSSNSVGPGPNYFSDSTNNIWLDSQGRLHLRITNRSNQWQCAEIVTKRTFGNGSYRFELDSAADNLNANVVLGLFTWSDDPAYTHREIDIECSRWGNTADANNAQYVIQPWDTSGHLTRYAVPSGLTNSTHLFIWETNRVTFQSLRGGYTPTPDATNVISAWTFTNAAAVPQTGDENVRINLWLYNGYPPTDSNEVEVIIRSFQFVPLGQPQPAVLAQPQARPDGRFQFTMNVQMDRRYEVQSSSNVLTWKSVATLLATNTAMMFTETNEATSPARFFRVITLP